MTEMLDLSGGLRRTLEEIGESGSADLCDVLSELMDGEDLTGRVTGLCRLKDRVFRLEVASGAPWRSVVIKRLKPAVAEPNRLLVECWLPALGLGDCCARLLGVAAGRRGDWVWHIYEDLGDETLAARLEPQRIRAAVELVAEIHVRAARHPVVPDVRRYGVGLGLEYFTANVRDAIAALEALADRGIETPQENAGLVERLRERLEVLLADAPRRAQIFAEAAGPDTLLHGDLWTINVFVTSTAEGPRARLVDWDRMGVGPFSYDLSTLLFRFPPAERPWIVECYRDAVAHAGWRLASLSELEVLFDTAQRARFANCVIWPARALLQERAAWGFPGLAEVERWFQDLDSA